MINIVNQFKKKSVLVKLFVMASISAFIFNACGSSPVFYISNLSNEVYYFNNTSSQTAILNNDTVIVDTIRLDLNLNLDVLGQGNQCSNYVPNPIGMLMSYSVIALWCYDDIDILITSSYDYNGIPAGSSLNDLFLTNGNQNIDNYFDNYLNPEPSDVSDKIYLYSFTKPSDPKQKFNIQLITNKGNYLTETVEFYWY